MRWEVLARNPAERANPPRRGTKPPITTWSPEEVRLFLSAVADDRLYAAFLVAATTGMRRGEVLGLRMQDLDLSAGRAEIRHTHVTVGYDVVESEPKTRSGRRSVALDARTVRALQRHRRRIAEERLAWGSAYQDSDLVFPREDGSAVHPDSFSKFFVRVARAAGLPHLSLHGLRHTYATIALRAGVHPKIVSERLGHSTVALTLDTYSHAVPDLQESAAEQVADLVFG